MKLLKPFSSYGMDGSLKERWIAAFHDPGFLIITSFEIGMIIALLKI
jgi:hypothetical protein